MRVLTDWQTYRTYYRVALSLVFLVGLAAMNSVKERSSASINFRPLRDMALDSGF